MEHGSSVLFHIGPWEVTSPMVTGLGIALLLGFICWLGTRRMQTVPSGLQNFLEMAVEKLDAFLGDLLEPDLLKSYYPFLATLFIFILASNYSGILPLAGVLPGLTAPTSVLSVTVSLALMVFVATHFAGLRHNGLHYGSHFTKPYIFLLPLLLIEEIVRPVSLSLRLYGNILGEETVTQQLYGLVPFVVPVIMNVFSLLMGAIQAMVFVLLACIYIQSAAGQGH